MRIRAGMMVLLAAAALAGCGRQAAPEPDPNVWEKSKDGSYETRQGSLDAPMPAGLPAYPNILPKQREEMRFPRQGGRSHHDVHFETPDSAEQAMAFYLAAAERDGWRITGRGVRNQIRRVSLIKGDDELFIYVRDIEGLPTGVTIYYEAGPTSRQHAPAAPQRSGT